MNVVGAMSGCKQLGRNFILARAEPIRSFEPRAILE